MRRRPRTRRSRNRRRRSDFMKCTPEKLLELVAEHPLDNMVWLPFESLECLPPKSVLPVQVSVKHLREACLAEIAAKK